MTTPLALHRSYRGDWAQRLAQHSTTPLIGDQLPSLGRHYRVAVATPKDNGSSLLPGLRLDEVSDYAPLIRPTELTGWVASNYGQAKNLLIILASLAIVILTGTIAIFNGKIEAAIERLGDL